MYKNVNDYLLHENPTNIISIKQVTNVKHMADKVPFGMALLGSFNSPKIKIYRWVNISLIDKMPHIHEFLLVKLKSSDFESFTWLTIMEYLSQMIMHMFTCRKHFPVLSSFMTYHRVCNQINTTGATSGEGTAYPSEASDFIPWFLVGFMLLDLQFYVYVLQIVVCPFVLFLLSIVLSDLL